MRDIQYYVNISQEAQNKIPERVKPHVADPTPAFRTWQDQIEAYNLSGPGPGRHFHRIWCWIGWKRKRRGEYLRGCPDFKGMWRTTVGHERDRVREQEREVGKVGYFVWNDKSTAQLGETACIGCDLFCQPGELRKRVFNWRRKMLMYWLCFSI